MSQAVYLGVGLLAIVVEHLVNKLTQPLKEHYPNWPWDIIKPFLALVVSVLIGMKAGLNVFTFIPGLADWSGVALTSALYWFGAEGIHQILKQLAAWAGDISKLLASISALKDAQRESIQSDTAAGY